MTTNTPELEEIDPSESGVEDTADENQNERRRRSLLLLLLLLLLLCCCAGYFIARYIVKPQPLPEMIPGISQVVNYPPTYKFSFPLDGPVGVATSPDGQRIYGVESTNERLLKMFDRDGNMISSFAPPFTTKANRTLTYIAVDANGRIFVVDSYNDVVCVFDAEGNFVDGIIAKDVSLTEFIAQQTGSVPPPDSTYYYDNANKTVVYQFPGEEVKTIPGPDRIGWAVVGVRFDTKGNLLVTNTVAGKHEVIIYPAADINSSWNNFTAQIKEFGAEGKGNGELSFPNTVVTDSRGNYYVADSNNGRISLWTPDMQYKTFFGFGSTENALNLPHGAWMDAKDRLHVADAVGAAVRVYDVSGDEPVFLYSFGLYGTAEGEFNFPNDIFIDGTSRLYIADRENNRIQVWSY